MNRLLVLATLAAAACSAPPLRPAEPPPLAPDVEWSADVAVADDLSRLTVTLAFRDGAPPRLVLGDSRGLDAIARDGDATRYVVDLERLADAGLAKRVGGSVSMDPATWLLRPSAAADGARASLVLRLPERMQASVPWPRRADGSYLLDQTALRWRSLVALGRLEMRTIDAAGATLDVAVLDRPHAATWAGIETWLSAAAGAQTSLFGEFPVPRAQVVVRLASSNQPVAFGEVLRGGGPAIVLSLADDAPDAALPADWVAVHEFAHLGMPAMPDADAWMSEGFVAYWHCVLRARAGLIGERAAWDELVAGFARGRADRGGGTLADESASMAGAHSHPAVYWSGAAVALLLDVELRRTSGGTRSLDDAMREIRRAVAARTTSVGAAEIVTHLDAWLGRPLFGERTRAQLASREFPATAETLARLGVVVEDGRVTRLDDAAPDAAVRRGVMRTGSEAGERR